MRSISKLLLLGVSVFGTPPCEVKLRDHSEPGVAMTEHAVVIAGGGPTGLMLAAELALANVDVAIVERRASQDLAGSRAGGLHSRTIEIFDQRGISDRLLSEGQMAQVAGFASVRLISTWSLPTGRCGSSLCYTVPGRCYSTSASPGDSTSRHGQIVCG